MDTIKCPKCSSEKIDQYDYDVDIEEELVKVTYDMQCMECKHEFEHERTYKKIKERVIGGSNMFFIKRMIRKSQEKRFNEFLNEYKSFNDELLWDYYCGLDMDRMCEGDNEYNTKMYILVEDELEKRNNKKYPVKGW